MNKIQRILFLSFALLCFITTDFSLLPANAAAPKRILDFDIAYYRYLNTEVVKNPEAAKIEEIIRFWADALYEATDGEHLLGTVRIFQGPKSYMVNYRQADIVWEESGHPRAAFGAWIPSDPQKNLGFRVAMFDRFVDYRHDKEIRNFLGQPQDLAYAGYALASLCGAYVYGLREEYALDRVGRVFKGLPRYSLMKDPAPAADSGEVGALNFSTANHYREGQCTAQKERWGESAWDTLVRNGEIQSGAKPKDEAKTEVEPGKHSRDAQRHLRIVWVSSPVYEIVIDRSGSMEGERLRKAKNAAKEYIRSLLPGIWAGLVSFAGDSAEEAPMEKFLPSSLQSQKVSLEKAVEGVSIGGNGTAIYDTCAMVGRRLAENRDSFYEGRNIILLTDGEDNRSRTKVDDLAVACRKEKISLTVIGLEEGVNEKVLKSLAQKTRGIYIMTANPLDTQEMMDAYLNNAFESQVCTHEINLGKGMETRIPLFVEKGVDSFRVDWVGIGPSLEKDLLLTVSSPEGKSVPARFDAGIGKGRVLQVNPREGRWAVNLKNRGSSPMVLRMTAFVRRKTRTLFLANALAVRGEVPGTALVYAALTANAIPLVGVSLRAELRDPSGKRTPLEFNDSGIGGDAMAGDGIYTAKAEGCTIPGNYKATISMKTNGKAAETNLRFAFLHPPTLAEEEPFIVEPTGKPMKESLERAVSTTFQVEGKKVSEGGEKVLQEEKPIDRERVASYLDRGEKAMKRGEYETADSYARDALRLDPSCSKAHCLLGEIRDAKNEYGEALPHYAKAIECEPGEPFYHFRLGQGLSMLRRIGEAESVFATMNRLFPANKWTNKLEAAIHFAKSN